MSPNSIQKGVRELGMLLNKNSPTILTGLSVAGLVSTVILAVQATPKAIDILNAPENMEFETCPGSIHVPIEKTKQEIIKLTWKCYIPAAAVGAATIACIIGANSISLRRNAALASLYTLTERAMQEYQAKVVETIGKNKEEKIKEQILQDKINSNPLSGNTIILTGKGNTLCYDVLSGRYFKNDIENIRRIQNDFNEALITEMYRSLNELYSELGLEETKTGRDTGWVLEHGKLEIIFSAKIADDGTPCIVIDYRNGPRMI
ncbi:TPA: hypothetical protein DCQ22_03970 [Candidatus Nomurabacteria bacterium]|nr:hypothetical protein [Candidatus Nomurabacteria bacterium]